jgi:hypothetical protein
MEIRRQISNVRYRIEPKPGGGFIARPDDPAVATIEAPTREELQQKIRSTALAGMLPGLTLPLTEGQSHVDLRIESKSGRQLFFNAKSGDTTVNREATQADIEQVAEKFSAILGKDFPELMHAVLAQATNAKKSADSGEEHGIVLDAGSPKFGNRADFVSNKPITAETNSSWKVLVFLVTIVIGGTLFYFFFHH